MLSSQLLLHMGSYISEDWHTTSWLHHCISTAEAHNIIQSIQILHWASKSDHVPFLMTVDFESLPNMIY